MPLVDWVGLDIKAPFNAVHYQKIIGVDHVSRVEKSLDLLLERGAEFECRTTCDPRFLTPADLLAIGKQLKAKGVKKYFLQKYRPVVSDKQTSDADCENLVSNSEVLNYMKDNFLHFEVRK